MPVSHIKRSIEEAISYLSTHPDQCRYTDSAATAVVEEGLRCRAEGPVWRCARHRHAGVRGRRGIGAITGVVFPGQLCKLCRNGNFNARRPVGYNAYGP